MYSEQFMALFHSRAHAGSLEGFTHAGDAGTRGQGPYIQVWLRVEEGVVRAARYKTFGCPACIACAEAGCGWSEGRPLAELADVTAEQVEAWVGGVPEGKEHCPELGALALRRARNVNE